tara:strand:+ start:717 stop:1718 length:1002 start_codon:yes stop_codon:yes gene_type:complete
MTFFDKKEEVMKIELTPHGKYLLSIGKLKPHSYRFFDENVIYDSNVMGYSENQNEAHERISNETPILKSNPNITGVETNIRRFITPSVSMKHLKHPVDDDTITAHAEALGTCAHESKNGSTFGFDVFGAFLREGEIKNYYSSPNCDNVPIPQIPINMHISSSVYEDAQAESYDENVVSTYADGSGFILNYENPIIRLREFNGFDEKDNFNITAYKVLSSSDGMTYTKLKFPKRKSLIVGNILTEDIESSEFIIEADVDVDGFEQEVDESYLGFYVDLIFDRNISDEEICERISDYEVENIFLDDEVICPDTVDEMRLDIYGSPVSEEDLEDCD